MALSMLTACGSNDTDTTAAAAAVASTATSRTDIVDYAIAQVKADYPDLVNLIIDDDIKGDETADLASAVKAIENEVVTGQTNNTSQKLCI